MFAVNVKRKALRNLEKLDKKEKQRITTIILILKKDPIPSGKPTSAN
jgi:mRNA-degrading endonuclease RelE of RelBE toxin-antitoxin system